MHHRKRNAYDVALNSSMSVDVLDVIVMSLIKETGTLEIMCAWYLMIAVLVHMYFVPKLMSLYTNKGAPKLYLYASLPQY